MRRFSNNFSLAEHRHIASVLREMATQARGLVLVTYDGYGLTLSRKAAKLEQAIGALRSALDDTLTGADVVSGRGFDSEDLYYGFPPGLSTQGPSTPAEARSSLRQALGIEPPLRGAGGSGTALHGRQPG